MSGNARWRRNSTRCLPARSVVREVWSVLCVDVGVMHTEVSGEVESVICVVVVDIVGWMAGGVVGSVMGCVVSGLVHGVLAGVVGGVMSGRVSVVVRSGMSQSGNLLKSSGEIVARLNKSLTAATGVQTCGNARRWRNSKKCLMASLFKSSFCDMVS